MIAALQENLRSLVYSSQTAQIQVQSTPTVTQSWSSVPFPYFNIIAQAADDADIGAVLQPYQEAAAVWFCIGAPGVEGRLPEHGLTLLDTRPCMTAAFDAIAYKGPEIDAVQVGDEAGCRDWVTVQSEANGGFPDAVQDAYVGLVGMALNPDGKTRAFVAYDDGQAVACSLLHMAGDVAGIWQVGTIPEARRKGYGSAITYAALTDAAERGCATSVLIATQMGRPVYEKMGYRTFTEAKVYLFQPR